MSEHAGEGVFGWGFTMHLEKASGSVPGAMPEFTSLVRACRDRGDWDEVLGGIVRSVAAAAVAGGPPRSTPRPG